MVAFRNGFPASPGQPPIVPRRHVTRLTDLEPDELTDLWLLGTSLCRDLERSLGASAFNLGMNVGLLPVTGLPLPLVSYGGSALLAQGVGLGLLVNVGLRPGYEVANEPFRYVVGRD